MSDIGKLTTFSRLLQEEPVVMIPKVQRDYAYGRGEEKVRAILNAMLDKMLEAIEKDHAEVFDFVYGGAYVKKEEVSDGLIPLDGQQRLTTMFLLHLYASIIQQNVNENSDAFKNLKKFRYETRQSATNFCEALVGKIRDDLRKGGVYSDRENIKEHIKDHPSYIPSYDSDPTIASMLNVLEVIEKKYKKHKIEDLWTKLVERDNIQFYCLSLDRFGLADDLYIKMNSRGKKLTEFEIFKSDLEKKVKDIAPDLKDELSRLLDNDWMDLLWDYATCYYDDKRDIVTKADGGYMHLFNNIFRIELFRRWPEEKTNRNASIEEIITGEDDVKVIMSVFKVLSDIYKQEGIVSHWGKYFYFSDEAVGRDDKIRLFWQQERNQKPVFHLAMERDLTVPEIVYFYTLVKVKLEDIDENTTQKILRVVRNLITANTRASSARYENLNGFIKDVDNIIANRGIVISAIDWKSEFLSTSWEEEHQKATALSDVYDELLKYENHEILQGSLMLFIEKYGDISDLCSKLRHFEVIFGKNYKDRFDEFRIALINKTMTDEDGYLQYDTSMRKETNTTRRMFIHNLNDLSPFLIKNEYRHNQDKILDEIAAITDVDSLKKPEEKCKEFDITSWQYYYVKYATLGANIENTIHGYYAWDDKKYKPLEMVILNSSYHSENNIEWKMLNHILYKAYEDADSKYKLDYHGSSPMELLQSGITITISQEGWKVQCKEASIIQPLYQSTKYKITKQGEDNMYLLEFKNNEDGKDYIDLAKDFIADIEAQPKPNVY